MRTKIPLQIIHVDEGGYHIFVKAKINGKAANLLVDTGASKSVLDANRIELFAEKMSMQLNDYLSTGLGTNSMQSHTIFLDKFQIGKMSIEHAEIYLLDLSHVNEAYKKLKHKALDGVIGGDLLNSFNAVIHYKGKYLVLDYQLNSRKAK